MHDVVIIRYGEIFLKGEFVKRRFEDILMGNIKEALKRNRLEGNILRKRHRLYIKTNDAEGLAYSIKKIPGIVSVSPATEIVANIPDINKTGLKLARDIIKKGDTFAVRTNRTGQHDFSSKDIEMELGSTILKSINATVDLENPKKTIFVEIRDEQAFVFDRKIKAVGGLPYGSQGRLVSLISAGIDSPVASFLMMRRGCEIVMVHLGSEEDVMGIIEDLKEYANYKLKLYAVPYDEILENIAKVAGKYTCVICKRTMLRIAEKICKKENAKGVVTGDSLGQVATQTLENLAVISPVTNPIYRPLIGMDKEDIIKIAREIGTYKLSRNSPCKYLPKKPATKSDLKIIEEIEEEIGIEKIIESIDPKCIKR